MNTPELKTERLILRKFTDRDINALFLILKDEEVNTFLPWFPVKNIEELARSMIRIRSNYKRMGNKAREYASNCFDSNELCIKILQQKMYYLKED